MSARGVAAMPDPPGKRRRQGKDARRRVAARMATTASRWRVSTRTSGESLDDRARGAPRAPRSTSTAISAGGLSWPAVAGGKNRTFGRAARSPRWTGARCRVRVHDSLVMGGRVHVAAPQPALAAVRHLLRPARRAWAVGGVMIGIDTSGSIGGEMPTRSCPRSVASGDTVKP